MHQFQIMLLSCFKPPVRHTCICMSPWSVSTCPRLQQHGTRQLGGIKEVYWAKKIFSFPKKMGRSGDWKQNFFWRCLIRCPATWRQGTHLLLTIVTQTLPASGIIKKCGALLIFFVKTLCSSGSRCLKKEQEARMPRTLRKRRVSGLPRPDRARAGPAEDRSR